MVIVGRNELFVQREEKEERGPLHGNSVGVTDSPIAGILNGPVTLDMPNGPV